MVAYYTEKRYIPVREFAAIERSQTTLWTRVRGMSKASPQSKPLASSNPKLLEHEGPHILDWRMCKGEWEIWANGFLEEGADEMRGNDRTMMIPHSEGWNSFTESHWFRELVAAEVICCSGASVHGILFLTGGGCTGEVFRLRYLGTHKVFAPTANIGDPSQPIFRKETTGDIIGLHCLLDKEDQKFLLLGLVLLINNDRIYETKLPHPIPFSDLDSKVQVWDDGPPPKEWPIASRPGEMGIFTCDFAPTHYDG
ncbi:hypothetical protein HOY82DRAFT_645648 [Tuber indicum]|nr:hypothetical protein HOY82DRAFT_645648 [Tuber indicum]